MLIPILISTLLISFTAFLGALALFLKEKILDKILLVFVAFSAGALIGGAFLHLLPEAVSNAGENSFFKIFLFALIGFCTFFILEQFIQWHHCHTSTHPEIKAFSYLILVSDGIHNFIDGLIIAGSFIVGFPVGIVTALVIALHEIPQEIGDFGVLVYGGFKKIKALFLNFATALTVVVGGVVGFFLAGKIEGITIFLLSFAAGHFIYIASSDLIPEIKKKSCTKDSLIHFSIFIAGIGLMLAIKLLPLNS